MKRFLTFFIISLTAILAVILILLFVQSSNNDKYKEVRIKKSWNQEDLNNYVSQEFDLSLPMGIAFWSEKIGFKIQTSQFVMPPNTSVWGFLNLLRANRNQTVNVVIPPGIYKRELIRILIKHFDFDKEELNQYFDDDEFWDDFGTDRYNWPSTIIPNTYNFSRNTDLKMFFMRISNETKIFWNADRRRKLRQQKLTLQEAVTLASIVQKESLKVDEYENIAGVYLNRLRINMFLGADPTLVFIRGKGGRVYNKDMKADSPYNTYRYKGLPPGPICIPSKSAIDAVLDYKEHRYLYFCAKSDLSGYHVFARHYKEHLKNARLFQRKLNDLERRKKR